MNKSLKQMFYPYIFALKEGPNFDKNFLSYSLLMMQINNEVLQSPRKTPAIQISPELFHSRKAQRIGNRSIQSAK